MPGHSLAIITSFESNVTSISIANPSSNQTFQNCSVIQQIFSPYFEKTGQVSTQEPLNVTLKTLDSIPPHFLLDFDAPTVPESLKNSFLNSSGMAVDLNQNSNHVLHPISFSEYAHRIGSRSWVILECNKPHESVAFPRVTIDGGLDAVYYKGGDTVHIRGIVGFPSVIVDAYGPTPYSTFVFKSIQTNSGGSFNFSFVLPSDVGKGTGWNIQVQMPDNSSDGFRLGIG